MNKQGRLYYVDFIRVIGMYSIILIHVTSIFCPDNSTAYIINQFSRFGVPIFFILSGISLYHTYPIIDKKNISTYYKKRFITIVIPYLLWIIIYFVYEYRHNIEELFTIEALYTVLQSIFLGKRHLYFLIIMIQFYIIYPLIAKIISLKKYDKLIIISSLIITLYLNLAAFLMRWYINITPFGDLAYLYLSVFSWLFYFILGIYFVKFNEKIKVFVNKNKGIILCLWVIMLMALIMESKLSNTYGSSIKPTVFIYSILSFFIFYYLSEVIVKHAPINILTWLSSQSFFVFLSHILVMELLKTYMFLANINIGSFILKGLLICVLSIIGAYVLQYIPFTEYLGVKKVKK